MLHHFKIQRVADLTLLVQSIYRTFTSACVIGTHVFFKYVSVLKHTNKTNTLYIMLACHIKTRSLREQELGQYASNELHK